MCAIFLLIDKCHPTEERSLTPIQVDGEYRQDMATATGDPETAAGGVSELELLKKRKGDLEEQLGRLQNSRRDLIDHLDELMQMLRVSSGTSLQFFPCPK